MTTVVVETNVVSLILKRHSLTEKVPGLHRVQNMLHPFLALGEFAFTIRRSDESLCENWASIRHQAFACPSRFRRRADRGYRRLFSSMHNRPTFRPHRGPTGHALRPTRRPELLPGITPRTRLMPNLPRC